ncbi:MAG: hypothetical protein QM750_11625 [Rubrivivax sp.]
MIANIQTERIRPALKLSALSAALLLSASAFAADETSASTLAPDVQAAVTAAVYAGGEGMPPEVEQRVMAMISGQASRADVRQELADARDAGLMPAAGELADSPEVLQARFAFNDRQTQTIMARYEADRQRLMAAQQAQAQASTMAAAAPSADAQPAAEPATAPMASAPSFSVGPAAPAAVAAESAAVPTDPEQPSTEQLIDEATAPDTTLPSNDHQRPASADEQPAAKPDEMPISGPVDADSIGTPVDTE